MSEILIETKRPTNMKSDLWYKKYLKVESYLNTSEEIKQLDKMADNNESHNNVCGFLQLNKKNNLDMNRRLLKHYKKELENFPLYKQIDNYSDIKEGSEQYCMQQTMLRIDMCFEALEQGYLITAQLEDISIEIKNYQYNEEIAKSTLDLLRQFKFRNYQKELFNFVKANSNWHKKERDFEIYQEIKNGKVYSELAEKFGVSIPSISMTNKKVQSSINNLKGRFFEIEFEKYLRSLNKFSNDKIVRDGDPGKPDIYIMDDNKKEIYILTLKNLELNKKYYCIPIEQLKPELEFAFHKNIFEGYNKVIVYLIVFDSLTERLFVEEIDYKNPSNVNINN